MFTTIKGSIFVFVEFIYDRDTSVARRGLSALSQRPLQHLIHADASLTWSSAATVLNTTGTSRPVSPPAAIVPRINRYNHEWGVHARGAGRCRLPLHLAAGAPGPLARAPISTLAPKLCCAPNPAYINGPSSVTAPACSVPSAAFWREPLQSGRLDGAAAAGANSRRRRLGRVAWLGGLFVFL